MYSVLQHGCLRNEKLHSASVWDKIIIGEHATVKTGQRRVDPSAVIFIRQRQNQTGNGQQAITGISEAEQRRKQYQAGVEVTSTGSEFQGKAVRGQTQKYQSEGMVNAQKCQPGHEQDFATRVGKCAAYMWVSE